MKKPLNLNFCDIAKLIQTLMKEKRAIEKAIAALEKARLK